MIPFAEELVAERERRVTAKGNALDNAVTRWLEGRPGWEYRDCARCGEPLGVYPDGRRRPHHESDSRAYCSNACRQAAYRERKRAAA